MDVTLNEETIKMIAKETADILWRRMQTQEQSEMVSTAEAANILNVTPAHLRRYADRYPHIKKGEGSKQGQLLFVRSALIK